jgi:hypothetical protein
MASSVRNYNSVSTAKTLNGTIVGGDSTININESSEDFPPVPFTLVIEPGVSGKEEIVTVTNVSGTQLTITRGEEGLGATGHNDGSELRHMATGRDFQEARDHIDSQENVHGISDVTSIVYKNTAQTLLNKTLTSPSFNGGDILTATSTELNYVDGVTSNVQTQLDAKTTALSAHEADTTSIHGIADTSKLVNIASTAAGRTVFVQEATPTAIAIGDIWFQVTGL